MMLFVGLVLFLMIIYAELIFLFNLGWKRLNRNKLINDSIDFNQINFLTTVIVALKNEEKNCINLINNFLKQKYPTNLFEIIFVNDHSTDNSYEQLLSLTRIQPNYKVLNSNGLGKKQALKTGIDNATGQLIVCLDADCIVSENWLAKIASYYYISKAKLIVCPVLIQPKGFFAQVQSLEFLSLQASTVATIGLKRPIMSNGANLAFERTLFYEWADPFKMNEISGDDLFLLHTIKTKYRLKIHFLLSLEAVATTKAAETIFSFFKQRKRWVSKSFSYKDRDTIVVAFVVLLANLALLVTGVVSILNHSYFNLFLFLFVLKTIPDFFLLIRIANFYQSKRLLLWFVPLQLIYPIYISTTVVLGLFGTKKWK